MKKRREVWLFNLPVKMIRGRPVKRCGSGVEFSTLSRRQVLTSNFYLLLIPLLNQQLEALDRHLYGSSAGGWSGEALAEMIMKWQKEETAHNHDKLPDLYPRL